ncbi:MAG: hypothetical protein AAGJ82_06155 [Bacteroidota bacterium]
MKQLFFLLTSLLLVACGTDQTGTTEQNTATDTAITNPAKATPQFTKQSIDPPLPAADIPAQQNVISATEGGRISLPSGTAIIVPANAFVYPTTGEAVTGKVTTNFREFHTAAEIILSGIPMRDWDETTQTWNNFATAGMFDLRGVDENQRAIEIAPNHSIEVQLASQVEGTFDFWYFDEAKGDWEQQGQNTGEAVTDAAPATSGLPARPQAPRKYNPEKIRVTFDGMNLADFPEISDPDQVALQYAGNSGDEADPEANEWIFAADWYEAKLSKTVQAGVYQLDLANDDETFTTQVKATLLPAAYQRALADYQAAITAYETALSNMDQVREIRRSMPVSRFGIYNYDVYSRWEEPVFAQVDFQPAAGANWSNLNQVYLVTQEGQINVRYPKSDWERFNFDRQRDNLILGVTNDAEVVMMSVEAFTAQSAELANDTPKQVWNCVLKQQSLPTTGAANLQLLIDSYFAS